MNNQFSDMLKGTKASAQIYSLMETAKAAGQMPYAYLHHTLERLPQVNGLEGYEPLMLSNCKHATAS